MRTILISLDRREGNEIYRWISIKIKGGGGNASQIAFNSSSR